MGWLERSLADLKTAQRDWPKWKQDAARLEFGFGGRMPDWERVLSDDTAWDYYCSGLESKIEGLEKTVELLTDRYSENAPKTVEEALAAADTTWADGTWAKQCARVLAVEVRRLQDEIENLGYELREAGERD